MVTMSAIEIARQRAEQQQGGGGNAVFFSLKEGESKILRFLNGLAPTYIVSHKCGLSMVDIQVKHFDEAASAGTQVLCPACGEPLAATDIIGSRHDVYVADVHNYFPTSEADKRTSFMCLASPTNASRGYVPATEAGDPLYACPACACQYNISKQTGKPKMPAMRLYGVAVEREGILANEVRNGVPTPVLKDIKDVYEEIDGVMQPKLVIVNMGWKNFWSKLSNWDQTAERSICNYDWKISRVGSGLDTAYDIQCLNDAMPTVTDMSVYEQFMPDIESMLRGMGTPEFYHKKGYSVPGYVPKQAEGQTAGAVAMQNMAQQVQQMPQAAPVYQASDTPMQNPVAPQPHQIPTAIPQAVPQQIQTGVGNDWSVVQNQLR